MTSPLQKLLDFTVETAYLAGRLTLGYFQAGVRPDFKADDTPVTIADRLSEELIRRRIADRFPTHSVLGEEGGLDGTAGASFRWIIDPIDGTKSFIRGVPLFGVLLALEVEGQAQVGAAYFPVLDEMVAAATGLGCWWNGRRAHVSPETRLERSFVSSTTPGNFVKSGKGAAWDRLLPRTYFQAGWGDAYGYALVATGRVEIMLDPLMAVWDAGPFLPILQEAGGYFGDWKGVPTIYGGEGLATTPALLPQVLELLSDQAGDPASAA